MSSTTDYQKISDDVYFVGKNVVLRMNVGFYQSSATGERIFYHKEYKYAYNNQVKYSIKRSFSYFLSLDNIKNPDSETSKESIMIRIQDLAVINNILPKTLDWFNQKKYPYLYTKNEYGDLKVSASGMKVTIDGLPGNKFIGIEPSIYLKGTQEEPGVRIYLNSESNYCDTNISNFLGFVETLKSFNIYMAAQGLLTYFAARPRDIEVYTLSSPQDQSYVPENKLKSTRKIQRKDNKSIFQELDNL